jgi:hypothetical protein
MNSHRLAFLFCSLAPFLGATDALAFIAPPQTGVIINETFDEYADQAAFEAVWTPTVASTPPVPLPLPEFGVLIPSAAIPLPAPNDQPPGLQGKAVYIENQLNVYAGPALGELTGLFPTLESPVRLSVDIFDDGTTRNKRTSVGIRSSIDPANIIELGHWNGFTSDPTDPSPTPPSNGPATGFAYRVIQFGGLLPPLAHQPNQQYFPLDPALESPLDSDALVTPTDIGPGWHRYSATIGIDFVTLTLDLFRDGKNNATGEPGVDSEVTWNILYRMSLPLDSLRFGGMSGLRGLHGGAVDNLVLERVQIPEPATLAMACVAILGSVRVLRRRA